MSALVALLVGVAWGVGPVVAFEDELGGDEPILHGVLADGAVGAPELPVEPLPSDEVAIVGGREVAPGDWDEVVLVISNGGLCTGTVIGPRVVLTAAHCVTNPVVAILFGSKDYRRDAGLGTSDLIVDVISFGREGYDAAVILLGEPAPVEPAPLALDCIVREHLQDGERAWMVGFGAIREDGGGVNSTLHEAGTTIVDRNCDQESIDGVATGCLPPPISPGGEVAGRNPTSHVCFGDSGGPLYLRTPEGPFVTGVASRLFAGSPARTPCSDGAIWVRPDAIIDLIEDAVGPRGVRYPVCNEPPQLVARDLVTRRNQSATYVPQATDPDGDAPLRWALTQEPEHGTAEMADDGTVVYTPGEDFVGEDSFTIRVRDGGNPRYPRTGQPRGVEYDVPVLVEDPRILAGCQHGPGLGAAGGLALLALLPLVRRRRRLG